VADLFAEALRLREQAAEWMDADIGWRRTLTTEQLLAYRMADLADAQLHATLALVEQSRGPRRGDAVAEWIKAKRDKHPQQTQQWTVLDDLLDTYRLHADCGVPLDQPTPVDGGA
jgi:hypothetical protein